MNPNFIMIMWIGSVKIMLHLLGLSVLVKLRFIKASEMYLSPLSLILVHLQTLIKFEVNIAYDDRSRLIVFNNLSSFDLIPSYLSPSLVASDIKICYDYFTDFISE